MSIYQLERDGDVAELGELLQGSDSAAVRGRAATALGEAGAAEERVVEGLLQTATGDEDAEVRAAAIDALDELGGDALRRLFVERSDVPVADETDLPVEALATALDDDVPELRMAAANAIARDRVAEAAPALLRRLDDPDPRVRLRAARAAGQVGDRRAVESLSSLVDDGSTRLRREIATALGSIGGEAALAALEPLLDARELPVRRNAVAALGQSRGRRPIGMLVGCLDDDAEAIRRTAVFSIVDVLSSASTRESHELREEVVRALSSTHDGTVVDALVSLFEESTEAPRRRNAVWLLGRVSDREEALVETLVAALDDGDETVRQFAATSLTAVDTPAVEASLLDALETTVGEGRKMVLYVLGNVGSERARRRLLSLLDEVDDRETQERTLAALSRLGGT